jgi:RNA polymerase sigma-70 factor (ECF subfamily)
MTSGHEGMSEPDDAIFTALYISAEQTDLPHQPPYDVDGGLQRFTAWLGESRLPSKTAADPAWPDVRGKNQQEERTAALTRIEAGSQVRLRVESLEEFFRYYWPRLLRFLSSQAMDSSLAEDAASDAFTAALNHWDRLLTYERPDSWLFKVGLRRLRRLEAQARERGWLAEDPLSSEACLQLAAATDEWSADHLDLLAAMRVLPRHQSEAVALRYLGDFTVKETAQILAVKEATVRALLSQAKASLRRSLGAAGPRQC